MKWKWFWILIAISLLPLYNLFTPGFPVTHDGQDHVARIANFYSSLSEGNIAPRWASNLNWGYGHPIMMFLYPAPSYIASLFHLIGFGYVDSVKLVFGFTYIVSLVGMFLWARAVWGTQAAYVASVLYGFAPYRFVDMYVRGAIGEHVAFASVGFVLWALYHLAVQRKTTRVHQATLGVGLASLILSHNAVSLMILPIVFLYAVYLWLFVTDKSIRFLLLTTLGFGFGFILSAFFWIPAFFEGKYTLRDIVTADSVTDRFVPWSWFFYSPWNYGGGNEISKSLGIGSLLAVVALFFSFGKLKLREKILAAGSICILLVSLWLMTSYSAMVWQNVSLLQKFQFPWRLLTITTLMTAVLGALSVSMVSTRLRTWGSIALCVVAIVGSLNMWRAREYKQYTESFFSGVYAGTTDTGESSPIWSVRFMEQFPKAALEVISGDASISAGARSTTVREYNVTATVSTRLVENTLYFPGWQIFVDRSPVTVQFQDPAHRGLMTFEITPGVHEVRVEFGQTALRKLADLISIIGIFFYILFLGTMPIWQKRIRHFQ